MVTRVAALCGACGVPALPFIAFFWDGTWTTETIYIRSFPRLVLVFAICAPCGRRARFRAHLLVSHSRVSFASRVVRARFTRHSHRICYLDLPSGRSSRGVPGGGAERHNRRSCLSRPQTGLDSRDSGQTCIAQARPAPHTLQRGRAIPRSCRMQPQDNRLLIPLTTRTTLSRMASNASRSA